MKTKNGFYDIFVKSSAKYHSKVAVRLYDEAIDKYMCYTYSEMFGMSEYIAQQLRQLNCKKGTIGLISNINIVVPCVVAAAHKCSTSFIFLDPNNVTDKAPEGLDYTCLISIVHADDKFDFEKKFKKPDRVIKVFGMKISFYDTTPLPSRIKRSYKFANTHSFIAMTSGSTGDQKRVEVPVQCIIPNISDLTRLFNITSDDVVYFSTPLTFDPSMVEILLAWMNGASLLIAPGKIEVLFPRLKQHAVTVWQTTPSKFFLFSNTHIKNKILGENSPLKILALGGEPLHGVQRLRELKHDNNKTKLFTLYGVTEMSCWACVAELDLNKVMHDHEVPLGNVMSETQITVELDPKQNKEVGTIILASKTRQCFIVNNENAGQTRTSLKFVDTGDLGEVNSSGTIYYRGRRDEVIKRFGSKINLRFIESTCMLCPRVKACACIWLPKPKHLVLYYCSDSLSSQDLSDFLKCKLDDKHWPNKIMRIDRMPVNSHGKVSKEILSLLRTKTINAPMTLNALRAHFLQELKSVLGLRVTYEDVKNKKFLSIGGSSFLAVALCNSLSYKYPEFGKFILPHLLSSKRNIDEIITLAEKAIEKDVGSNKKRQKKSELELPTETSSSIKRHKVQNARSPANLVEFCELWTWNSGKCVDATPALLQTGVNLYVTVGSHSGIVAVMDGLTGLVVGEINVRSRVEAAICCFHKWATMPACGVVGTYDGTIVCFTIETCEEVWRTQIRSMVKSKAVCCQGFAFVASYDGNIRKLDLLTGKEKVVTSVSEQAISADLVLAKNEYIMVGSLSGVYGAYHIPSSLMAWRCCLDSPIFAAPVVYAGDKYAIFSHVNGEIDCMTVEKGIKIWKYSCAGGNIFSSMLVLEPSPQKFQLVFGCYDKHLYSITVKNFQPSLGWKTALSAPIYATSCKLADDKFLMAASNDGKLNIVSRDFGVVVAQYSLPEETFSSPVCFGDYIFIGCRDNLVYSLRYILNM